VLHRTFLPFVCSCLFSTSVVAEMPQSVMIHTQIVFNSPADGIFTATEPLCPSGEFITVQYIFNPSQLHGHGFMVEALYTCDDGSGTFNIQYHPVSQGWLDPEFLLTGPWAVVKGGTGKFTRLTGSGDFGVVIDFDQEPWTGEETFVGTVQLK